MEPFEIVATAILGTVAAIGAGWFARKVGKWLLRAIGNSLAESIRDVMKPDLDKVQHSVNAMSDATTRDFTAMSEANTRDHQAVQARIAELESRQAAVESRLSAVEVAVNTAKETPS